jgi:hypothetical protein
MSNANTGESTWQQKAVQDLKDFIVISLYLAVLFCALAAYTNLLLREYHVTDYLDYAFAVINALVIAKVILLGEMAHLGTRYEGRPLYLSAIYKAFLYGLLVLAFHFVEEFLKRLIHGQPFGTVWHDIRIDILVGRCIVIFCTFIPLFLFRELRRVLGIERFNALFYKAGAP